MRVACEHCGHLGEPNISAGPDGGVILACAECQATWELSASSDASGAADDGQRSTDESAPNARPFFGLVEGRDEPAPPEPLAELNVDDAEAGPVRCPKCGLRQQREPAADDACRRCGLAVALFDDERRPWERIPPEKRSMATAINDRFDRLLAGDFLNEEAHAELIQTARVAGLLDSLARRYRFFAEDHPESPQGQQARKSLDHIVELMNAEFAATPAPDWSSMARVWRSVLFIIAAMICVGVIALILYYRGLPPY